GPVASEGVRARRWAGEAAPSRRAAAQAGWPSLLRALRQPGPALRLVRARHRSSETRRERNEDSAEQRQRGAGERPGQPGSDRVVLRLQAVDGDLPAHAERSRAALLEPARSRVPLSQG